MLAGIKVIEHATYMAAPGAAGILADWGADVIKIEPPGGDPIRKFFGTIGTDIKENPVFDFDNRGKRSVVLDARSQAGADAIRKLAESADVFLTNVRPGGLERSGLAYEQLKAANPKLVYCSLTGYGLEGPDRDRPGFDVASFWSRTGVASLTIPKGKAPFPLRTAYGDHTTSLAAAAGICAALVNAGRTGEGTLVEASLLRAALYALGSDFAIQLYFGRIGSTKSRHEQIQPLMNFFRTADGHWICVVPRQGNVDFAPICRAAGVPELADDERFATAKLRRKNSKALVNALDEATGALSREALAERLDAEAVAWAPVQTLGEAAEDPQVAASGAITQMPADGGASYKAPGAPLRFSTHPDQPAGPAPAIGQHTREVLQQAGLDNDAIDELIAGASAAKSGEART